VLDLIVLGIGEDGHVASLFPDAPTLDADESRACVGVHDSPKPPPERITLTLSVLRAARRHEDDGKQRENIGHWCRVEREADGTPIADVFTLRSS